jgi:hypothetical protein
LLRLVFPKVLGVVFAGSSPVTYLVNSLEATIQIYWSFESETPYA